MAKGADCGLTDVDMSHARAAVLVVSKPYQLLMGLSVLETENITAHLVIMNAGFRDPTAFIELLENHPVMRRIESVKQVPDYESLAQYRNLTENADLLVEDDRVSLYDLFLSLGPRSLSVFEEGIGTYLSHYWQRTSTFSGRLKATKWFMRSLVTGCGLKMGGGKRTRAVYCARPELFARLNPEIAHKARPIPGLHLYREHFAGLIARTVRPLPQNDAIMALLGWHAPTPEQLALWTGAKDQRTCATDRERALYYKPHPHRPDLMKDYRGGRYLPDTVPAEFLIDFLGRHHGRLDIYHSASSACVFYPFELTPGVKFHSTIDRWYTDKLKEAMDMPAGDQPNSQVS